MASKLEEIVTEDLFNENGREEGVGKNGLPDPEDVKTKDDGEDSDFEIEVIDDTPEEDQRPAPSKNAERLDPDDKDLEEEIENYSEKAKKRFQQLKYEFHEERRQREAIERQNKEALNYARSIISENNALKEALQKGAELLTTESDEKSNAKLEAAKRRLKDAYDNGDTDAMIEAQAEISTIQAQRFSQSSQLADALGTFNTPPREYKSQPNFENYEQPRQPQVGVPDSRAMAWIRENPWFQSPGYEDVTGFAMGMHEQLVRQGYNPTVHEEYYQKIDSALQGAFGDRIGKKQSVNDEGRNGARPHAVNSRSAAAPVASPSRGGKKSPRKVQLTSTQVALAKRLGLTTEQYAKQVAKEASQNG